MTARHQLAVGWTLWGTGAIGLAWSIATYRAGLAATNAATILVGAYLVYRAGDEPEGER